MNTSTVFIFANVVTVDPSPANRPSLFIDCERAPIQMLSKMMTSAHTDGTRTNYTNIHLLVIHTVAVGDILMAHFEKTK